VAKTPLVCMVSGCQMDAEDVSVDTPIPSQNDNAAQNDKAAQFFDRFVVAFATFDPAVIADLFATPGVALRRDGSLVALTTRDDVIRYYRAATEGYHHNGCRSCRWADLQVTASGSRSMLAAVTWDLLHEDGSIMTTWRQSYYLRESEAGLTAFASASHAD
jgi:hypothetical protein